MTVSSTIPALKANLLTTLRALTTDNTNALYKVRVSYGDPRPGQGREFVVLGDVEGNQEWAALGHQRREEEYLLTVYIHSSAVTVNQQAVTERCFAMAAAVEVALRADVTVGGAVRVAGFGGGDMTLTELSSPGGKSRGADLMVKVACKARI